MKILSIFDNFPAIVAHENVKIEIRPDGLCIWIYVDSECVARILSNGMIDIKVEDHRK